MFPDGRFDGNLRGLHVARRGVLVTDGARVRRVLDVADTGAYVLVDPRDWESHDLGALDPADVRRAFAGDRPHDGELLGGARAGGVRCCSAGRRRPSVWGLARRG